MASSSEIEKALDAIQNKNYSEALALLTPLAEAGNFVAICNLATLYHCGLGVYANGERAIELYLKVARQNIREEHISGIAYHNLATIYTTGMPGVERDLHRAQEYERFAEGLGFDM